MIRIAVCLLGVASALGAAGLAEESAPNAMQRTVDMLENLLKETEDEAAKEAKIYDDFACTCNNQQQEYIHKISNSKERIGDDQNGWTMDKNNGDKQEQKQQGIMDQEAKNRDNRANDESDKRQTIKKETDKYNVRQNDHKNTISAINKAIKIVRAGKREALLSVKATIGQVLTHEDFQVSDAGRNAVAALMQGPENVDKRQDSSSAVLKLLDDLRTQATDDKANDQKEWVASLKQMTEELTEFVRKKDEAIANHKKAEQRMSDGKSDKEAADDAINKEKAQMRKDKSFLQDLIKQCNDDGKAYHDRADNRNSEMKSMRKGIDELKTSLGDYGHVKAALLQGSKTKDNMVARRLQKANSPSLLQIQGSTRTDRSADVQRALAMIAAVAKKTQSAQIETLLMQAAAVPKGAFDNIRNMIKDLITKLNTEMKELSSKSSGCQQDMTEAQSALQDARTEVEEQDNEHAKQTHNSNVAAKDGRAAEHAKNNAIEDKEIRTKDHEELDAAFNECIDHSKKGKESLGQAIEKLSAISGFVQIKAEPASMDTEGSGTADEEGGNIIAMLETIKGEFEAQETKCIDEQKDENTAFDQRCTELDQERDTQQSNKEDADQRKADAEDSKMTAADERDEQQGTANKQKDKLATLKEKCTMGESFEERNKRRQSEIDGLQNALKVLRAHSEP